MLDPHLIELMNKSASAKPTSKFELAFENSIKTQVDTLVEKAQYSENKLLSPELRRAKIEQEVRKEVQDSDSSNQIRLAVKILLDEGSQFLEKEQYAHLSDNIINICLKLNDLNLSQPDVNQLQEAMTLPEANGQSILEMAINKYNMGLIDESLAIFAFLTTVNPNEPDYWFRLGLTAEKCEKYPLALNALNTASELAPEFVGSHVYAVYCHLKMKAKDEAVAELTTAKEIADHTSVDNEWKAHIRHLEYLLTG